MSQLLSAEQIKAFHQDGYVLLPALFNEAEVQSLATTARSDHELQQSHLPVRDASGRLSKLTLWNDASDDIYGRFARSERVVRAAQQLLDDEVYHYHSKLSLKEPRVGGAWEWHQDYGYWYDYGCLKPQMLSALTAIDRCDRANGCIQVLKGSHMMGRLDHGKTGTQTGADKERVDVALGLFERVFVEQAPGDTLLFHCNLLHSSAPNDSDRPRWTLITAYNAKGNDPYKDSIHPRYTPLAQVPDDALLSGPSVADSRTFAREPVDTSATP